MKRKNITITAFALSAALICSFAGIAAAAGSNSDTENTVNAEASASSGNTAPVQAAESKKTINIEDTSISLESINKNWKEISDQATLHTFTNDTDKITVLKYSDYEDLPSPAETDDQYGAIYQTFYSAGDDIYVVTGCAVQPGDITEVKEIMDCITYPAPKSASNTDSNSVKGNENSGASNSSDAQASSSQETNASSDGSDEKANAALTAQGWTTVILYDADQNSMRVTLGSDGNWYDDNGVSYGNLDEADPLAPVYNENGEVYYWRKEDAAASSGSGSDDTGDSSDSSEGINDPYDLYSWDEGTNQFIPFQKAETDGSPVGKGNGWYYYDDETQSFLPW